MYLFTAWDAGWELADIATASWPSLKAGDSGDYFFAVKSQMSRSCRPAV